MQSFYIIFLPLIVTFYFFILRLPVECKKTDLPLEESKAQHVKDVDHCPLWFFYNTTSNQCECYNSIPNFNGPNLAYPIGIKCVEEKAFISYYNYFITHSDDGGFVFGYTLYFDVNAQGYVRPISEPGFIELPRNISELNDYMCGSASRKGFLCSECIDGFGPSATSPKFKCSNCTTMSTRYRIVLYLFSELVPVSIFYFIVLIFQINLTSAPMVSFILYCQLALLFFNYIIGDFAEMKYFVSMLSIFYGVWNLDFFRYVLPPFCISEELKTIHIYYLQCISTVFPFVLIGVTWISIEMHYRNFRIVIWVWRGLNKLLLKHFKVNQNSNRTVVNAFATFFLLTYAKLVFILLIPLCPLTTYFINDTALTSNTVYQTALDPTVKFLSKHHVPYATISILIFLIAIIPPVLLLALYPVRAFRSLLFRCCRRMDFINFFVEKFYSSYRDGLDGGRDMRCFASLYFFIVLLVYLLWTVFASYCVLAVAFLSCSFFNLIVQPCKEKYMSITDALIFANLAILSITLEAFNVNYGDRFRFYEASAAIFAILPVLWLVCFITFKVLNSKIKALIIERLPCCNFLLKCGNRNEDNEVEFVTQVGNNNDLPDRVSHPERYMQWGYDSIS